MSDDLVKRLREAAEHSTTRLNRSHIVVEAADRIKELERHIELRDWFLVENDLWERFAKGAEEKK